MHWSTEESQGQIRRILWRIGVKMLKAALPLLKPGDVSLWEHLDVLRGGLDQSFCCKDGLRRRSDLSRVSLLSLLLPVSIYLPELPAPIPLPVSVSPLFVLPLWRSEYQRGSPTDVLKHKWTVIKDDISKPHSVLLCSPLIITGDCSLLDNIWEAWRMANYVP